MSPGYQGPLDELKDNKESHTGGSFDPGDIPENPDLRKLILRTLKDRTELNSSRVIVKVKGEIAELTGKVDGPVAKATIEGWVRAVKGVAEVISFLEIDESNLTGVQGISLT